MEFDGHDAVEELLGAYALDAVDAGEAALVERHLAVCARCRAEVAEHREVAGLLAHPGAAAPDGVWERIAGQLQEAPPPLRLEPVGPHRSARRRALQVRLLAAAAAAVVAVVAVLGVEVVRLNHRTNHLPAVWTVHARQAAWQVALANPNARRVTLRSGDGQRFIKGVVLADGTSFLGPTNLAGLPSEKAYQLWGIVGSEAISLGVVGGDPAYHQFSTPASVSTLAITVERAGGSVAPTGLPVVAARLGGV